MSKTKMEKLNEIKNFLTTNNANSELVELITNEMAIIENKYAGAKMKKQAKLEKEYKELEPIFLNAFENNKDLQIGNDCPKLPDLSVSKKSQVFGRLIEKKLVKKIPPKGKQKRVLYQLV